MKLCRIDQSDTILEVVKTVVIMESVPQCNGSGEEVVI